MKSLTKIFLLTFCFLFVVNLSAQEQNKTESIKTDTVTVESKLIKKYESEVDKLTKALDQVYMQVAVNDPIVTNRMNQLLDSNPQAVSIMTALQLYTKLIEDLKDVAYGGTKEEEKKK